jgi:hypothetical protein
MCRLALLLEKFLAGNDGGGVGVRARIAAPAALDGNITIDPSIEQ